MSNFDQKRFLALFSNKANQENLLKLIRNYSKLNDDSTAVGTYITKGQATGRTIYNSIKKGLFYLNINFVKCNSLNYNNISLF